MFTHLLCAGKALQHRPYEDLAGKEDTMVIVLRVCVSVRVAACRHVYARVITCSAYRSPPGVGASRPWSSQLSGPSAMPVVGMLGAVHSCRVHATQRCAPTVNKHYSDQNTILALHSGAERPAGNTPGPRKAGENAARFLPAAAW